MSAPNVVTAGEAGNSRAVVVIAGPTACGKSACALALAEAMGGTVINADSMQVYRDLRVITARPSEEDEATVPHKLYGFLGGDEVCSAGRWSVEAARSIEEAWAAGRLPIVVGGTGLYINALIRGLSPIPAVPDAVRQAARALMAEAGPERFHALLAQRDPEMAARLPLNDTQRHVRAWEVLEATGRPLSAWQRLPLEPPLAARFLTLLFAPPREPLCAACDARLDVMMAQGAFEEVKALDALGLPEDAPILKALGVPELRAAHRGIMPLAEAVVAAKAATRQFAKRQMTWFRGQLAARYRWDAKFSESLREEIFMNVRQFLLTD